MNQNLVTDSTPCRDSHKASLLANLASGDKVIIAENGFLVEVFPDGSRKVLKEIGKPVKVYKRLFTIVK